MPQMWKTRWVKVKALFTGSGRSREEGANSFLSSVNEEYTEAFRTKSFIEIWEKVHGRLEKTSSDRHSSPSSLPLSAHLTEYLLEPRQDTLEGMNLHSLLIEFFKASSEACKICEMLLHGVHQTRANYQNIMIGRSVQDTADYTDEECQALFGKLAAFALLKNPLSNISSVQFRDFRDSYTVLFGRLTSKHRQVKRKATSRRVWKKVAGIGLVISHAVLLILLLLFAFHSIVGILAAPALAACSLGISAKKLKEAFGGLKTRLLERLGGQLDVAAKGIYILINDFDTMSRMVTRLHDEVEHCRAVADICVKNGKRELLKEAVREFQVHNSSFLDQLEELEEHIHLSFLTINRSRTLVVEKIMATHQRSSFL